MKTSNRYISVIISIMLLVSLIGLKAYKKYQDHQVKNTSSVSQIDRSFPQDNNRHPQSTSTSNLIPQKVYTVLNYVREHHQAPPGYVGGREFKNLEHHLESKAADGHRIHYQEWDVNPKRAGRNRGTERLVTSDEDRAWYSNDHYQSFIEVK